MFLTRCKNAHVVLGNSALLFCLLTTDTPWTTVRICWLSAWAQTTMTSWVTVIECCAELCEWKVGREKCRSDKEINVGLPVRHKSPWNFACCSGNHNKLFRLVLLKVSASKCRTVSSLSVWVSLQLLEFIFARPKGRSEAIMFLFMHICLEFYQNVSNQLTDFNENVNTGYTSTSIMWWLLLSTSLTTLYSFQSGRAALMITSCSWLWLTWPSI